MIYTTLAKIKTHDPCASGWEKLIRHLGNTEADDEPLGLDIILRSNGFENALWALRAVEGHDREIRHLACDFAEHVLHVYERRYPDDSRPRTAIEVSRRYVDGLATKSELVAARAATRAAARAAEWAAATNAAYAAADAAAAAARAGARAAEWSAATRAAYAAADAAGEEERAWQEQHFREWLNDIK